jgi:hypothetical protein
MRTRARVRSFNMPDRTYLHSAGAMAGLNQEESMRTLSLVASIAVLCGSVAFGAASASAEQTASLSDCVGMAGQVKTALTDNAQSPNYQDAVKQQGYGRDFCGNSFYKTGVDHYAEALRLLGVAKS